jgi:KDO2-lipid IV(A) lauroyltransferase
MVALPGLRRAATASADHATAAGYLAGWRLVRWLAETAARAVFARIADEVYRRDGASVRRLRANLARVRPGLDDAALDDLTREGVRSYLRYWCESFRLPSWPVDDLVRRTRTVGAPHPQPYASGQRWSWRCRMGNWDWAGTWACAAGMPLLTVGSSAHRL